MNILFLLCFLSEPINSQTKNANPLKFNIGIVTKRQEPKFYSSGIFVDISFIDKNKYSKRNEQAIRRFLAGNWKP